MLNKSNSWLPTIEMPCCPMGYKPLCSVKALARSDGNVYQYFVGSPKIHLI